MKKNNCVLITILSLGLAFAPLTKAFAENNLVQLDLKKGSGNAVDMTFFTSENYGGNVIVRKKSDNKYVVLMPKVLTSGYRSTDLGSVHDLITNVDVKSINDGAAGYTKITVITTKPLNITTHVAKAEPLTDGQKQYRTLLAEAYTVKNNINKTAPQKTAPQKTEVTVNKAPQQNSQVPKNNSSAQNTNNQSVQQQDTKPQIKLTPIDTKNLTTTKQENNINNLNSTENMPAVPLINPKPAQPTVEAAEQPLQDVKEVKKLNNKNLSPSSVKSHMKTLKREVQQKMSAGIATTLILVLVPLLTLLAFIRLIKSSIKSSRALKKSFLERISKTPRQKNYDHIINNKNLNWQEKYQLFINQSETDNIKSEPSTQYTVEKAADTIDEQRQKLEQLVTPQDEPKIDTTPIKSEDVKVLGEETAIGETLKNDANIKAFDPTLTETKRNVVKKKSRFTRFASKDDYEQVATHNVTSPIQHRANIQLKQTPLTGSARALANANLKVADIQKDNYIMSSLEEFFAITSPVELPNKPKVIENLQATPAISVASTLAQIKPSMKIAKPVHKEPQNPIELTKSDITTVPTFSGLIVKTGYNVDDERGFYIVNLDGTSALIGRIKEEIFVLKKFDDNETKHLQVRQDKDNIYMVKTDGFKSLINIDNMGVLIEL